MSSYINYLAEVRMKDNNGASTWKCLYLYHRPYSDTYEPDNSITLDRVVEIEGERYIKSYSFIYNNYILLRDYIFSSNAWYDNNLNSRGLPSDLSEEARKEIGDRQYGYSFTNFTLNELETLANKIESELKQKAKDKAIMDFSVEFCKRLGHGGKEDLNDYEYDLELQRENEDLTYLVHKLHGMHDALMEMYENAYVGYYQDSEIRITLWIE